MHCTQNLFESNLCPTTSTHILILQIVIPATFKEKEMKHNQISNNFLYVQFTILLLLLLFSWNA